MRRIYFFKLAPGSDARKLYVVLVVFDLDRSIVLRIYLTEHGRSAFHKLQRMIVRID
jgi:hypothetical protein